MKLPISLFSTPWLDEATFINLGTIAFCLMIVFALVGIVSLARGKSTRTAEPTPAKPAPVADTPAPVAPPAADDGALIAVLTAAVAATLEAEAAATGNAAPTFRVVSFKPVARSRSWNGVR